MKTNKFKFYLILKLLDDNYPGFVKIGDICFKNEEGDDLKINFIDHMIVPEKNKGFYLCTCTLSNPDLQAINKINGTNFNSEFELFNALSNAKSYRFERAPLNKDYYHTMASVVKELSMEYSGVQVELYKSYSEQKDINLEAVEKAAEIATNEYFQIDENTSEFIDYVDMIYEGQLKNINKLQVLSSKEMLGDETLILNFKQTFEDSLAVIARDYEKKWRIVVYSHEFCSKHELDNVLFDINLDEVINEEKLEEYVTNNMESEYDENAIRLLEFNTESELHAFVGGLSIAGQIGGKIEFRTNWANKV